MTVEEFYVGYAACAPEQTGRFVRRVVMGLLVAFLLVAAGIVFAFQPFARSTFGFGTLTVVEGVADGPAVDSVWLVGQGKRGFSAGAASRVRVTGAPIERDGIRMLEVMSLQWLGPAARLPEEDLGSRTVSGEIVDTKCYLGVMNPGAGKVHRDCARNCLRGGIPAAIADETGLYFIEGPIDPDLAGQRVKLTGRVIRKSGRLLLRLE
jgi:hypothetical protein